MASITERPADQGHEQGRIDRILHTPMSRRRFLLQASGAVLSVAMIAEGCNTPQGAVASGSPRPTDFGPSTTPGATIPVENSPLPHIDTLTGDTFIRAFSNLDDTTEINIPNPNGTITKSGKDLTSHASEVWNDNITTFTASQNPMHAFELAITSADMTSKDGTIDMSQIFPEMSLKLSRFALSALPNGKDIETTTNVFPQNLVLRKGMNMIVVGVDDSTKEAIVALEDTLRKPDGTPTMYLSALPLTVQGETDGQVSLNDLLARNGASYDDRSHSILYETGEFLALNSLDSILSQNLHQTAGSYFLDLDPLKKNKDGTPAMEINPIIPTPDANLVPVGNKIQQLKDGRVVTVDNNGNPTARAIPLESGTWNWEYAKSGEEFLMDYTPREYADALGMKIGSVSGGWLFFNDTLGEKNQFVNEVNIATVDSGFYWKEIEPQRGVFDFSWADKQVAEWQKAGMEIRVQALVYPSATDLLPDWLKNGNYSATELTKIMTNHIKKIMEHYKGKVSEWDVVNEPYNPGISAIPDIFYETIGENYIDLAFQAAREADPSAKLYLNDNDNNHRSGIVGRELPLVQRLKQKGLIDAIGLEMHMVDMSWVPGGIPTAEDVTSTIKNYGIPAIVTEFDYDLSNFHGTEQERLQRQADIYQRLIQASINAGVKEFTFWGLEDMYSGARSTTNAEPTMFTDPTHPKPAYFAIRDLFKQNYLHSLRK